MQTPLINIQDVRDFTGLSERVEEVAEAVVAPKPKVVKPKATKKAKSTKTSTTRHKTTKTAKAK